MATPISRNQWSLKYDLVPGGLVLQEVRHDNFNLASDIRVTRVWVDTSYPLGQHLTDFTLNDARLPATGPVNVLEPSSATQNPGGFFNGYLNQFGLYARFRSKTLYLGGTANECDVDVNQRYLFTDYGKSPPHEPGGVLDAARIFPLLTFSFPPVKDGSKPYPKYFRADFRLDVGLDNIDESDLASGSFLRGDTTTNKAGIFRDQDVIPQAVLHAPPGIVEGILSSPIVGVTSGPGVQVAFAALEKPVRYEVTYWGLVNGVPPIRKAKTVSRQDTWDNVHIWPAKRGGERGAPISTPGAFHAFHCHWRWGAVAGDPSAAGPALPQAGQPQFTGVGWSQSAGGALIDARIPQQNIQFAITKNNAPGWAKDRNPSESEFSALFRGARGDFPDVIVDGDDLVFWLSFEAFRPTSELQSHWQGNFFVNGFYFGHNKDNTPALLKLSGAYGEASLPAPKRDWQRAAR